MIRYSFTLLTALLLLIGCSPSLSTSDSATSVTWAPARDGAIGAGDETLLFYDSVALQNDHIRMAISPAAGRVVWFGPANGDNLLWIAPPGEMAQVGAAEKAEWQPHERRPYANMGGDKVWPTVQALWARAYGGTAEWPPDGVIDGEPWTVVSTPTKHEVTIRSPVSVSLGVQVDRTFTLEPNAPVVRITNRILKLNPAMFPLHTWSVTQTVKPNYVLLDVAKENQRPPSERHRTWVNFDTRSVAAAKVKEFPDAEAVSFTPHDLDGGLKIATLGEWIAGVYDDVVFVQRIAYQPTAAYADGSSIQTYADGRYVELETLGPTLILKPAERMETIVEWRLEAHDNRPAAELADMLNRHLRSLEDLPPTRVTYPDR